MYYTANLNYCIIFEYQIGDGPFSTVVRDAIEEPRAYLDEYSMQPTDSQKTASLIKKIRARRQKITFHNKVLISVDQISAAGVFGPSIDTLVLAQLTASLREASIRRVAEIGCGSGAIISAAVKSIEGISHVTVIDVSSTAIASTLQNLRCTGFSSDNKGTELKAITAKFEAASADIREIDLLISNPLM